MKYHLTLVSSNEKTGPIPVSTSSNQTCPDACPFKVKGCYAKSGPLKFHWNKVSDGSRGYSWSEFTKAVGAFKDGTFWRHNQAGDLPGLNDKIDTKALEQLVAANKGKRGFTYTHKPPTGSNAKAIANANANGFTINLSGNNTAHADRLAALNIGPVATVVPQNSPDRFETAAGNRVVVCPAQRIESMSCDKCRLCSKADRGFIIGFRPHGTSKKAVEQIANA